MARYYFHITDGLEIPDETGTPLNSVEDARQEALKGASELLLDGTDSWSDAEWSMRVADEAGAPVFTVRISIDEHGK
jgi:hypothetical protein